MKKRRLKSKFPKNLRKLRLWWCRLDEAPRVVGRGPLDRGVIAVPRRRSAPRPLLAGLYAAGGLAPYRRRRA